jgi:hypothetical protein
MHAQRRASNRFGGDMNAKPSKKQYEKPTFIKGPVLSSVTAALTISGIPSDESLS